jgi:hypothetical protein
MKLEIYCKTINYYNLLDNLPKYIIPLGLGKNIFPKHWLKDSRQKNISHLNNYYGELTGLYWLWKNKILNYKKNSWIGSCQYRRLWLNKLYFDKQKFSVSSLYSNLLTSDNKIFSNSEAILVQPVLLTRQNLSEQFNTVHKTGMNLIKICSDFLNRNEKKNFLNYLNKNQLSCFNMFITKPKFFNSYCEELFPWIDKCFKFCKKNGLLKSYNIRLPAFLAERFTSYWFTQNLNVKYLSHARIGNVMLSNDLNRFFNITKFPLTFRMYPTLYKY